MIRSGRLATFGLAGALLTLAAALALAAKPARQARAQTSCDGTTMTDPTQTIEVTVGRPIMIQQPANVTTGYEWLISAPPDPTVAQIASAHYLAPAASNPPRAGQGGSQCWELLAVGAGSTTMTVDYRRPFELANPDYQSVTFRIVVDPAG